MLNNIPWESMWTTAVHTFIIFWVTILIIRFVSARVFSQTSPEYLLLLLLMASGMYSGIAGENPTIWNSLATGLTLLLIVVIINKLPFLRRFLTGKPIVLVKDRQLNTKDMERTLIQVDDLNKMAREYGFPSYEAFKTIILETSGHLTGIIDLDYYERMRANKK